MNKNLRGELSGTLHAALSCTLHVSVHGIGLLGPGLAGWQASAALVFGVAS